MEELESHIPAARPRGGFGRFLRRLLNGLLLVLLFLLLGGLATAYFLYWPARSQLEKAHGQIADLAAARNGLTLQLSESQERARALQADLQAVGARLDTTRQYVAMLSLLSDVTAARLALASNDPDGARGHLSHAPAALDSLARLMGQEQRTALAQMRQRLQHALGELDGDQYAAQSDLNVLANKLVQLRGQHFVRP